jgi:excisionase family DNA binding protein
MDDLLTTKQLQDLLKIDRTTIYRMLTDGRLVGVKVGNQWRFPRAEIEAFLSSTRPSEVPAQARDDQLLPLNCIQPIQDVFADIAQVGSLTTASDGTPLTTISNPCRFCTQILSSESGRQACIASWRKLAMQSDRRPNFVECHAGLHYARARIEIDGDLKAMVIAGQFYASTPDSSDTDSRIRILADRHHLDASVLAEAAGEIPVIDERKERQIGAWMEKIAETFEHFGRERSDLMSRLRKISDMSTVR